MLAVCFICDLWWWKWVLNFLNSWQGNDSKSSMSFVCFLKYGHQPPPFSVCVRVCPAFPGHNILSLMPAASGTINPETQSLPARKPCLSPYIKQPVLHVGSPPLWASAPRRSRGRTLCRGPGSPVLGLSWGTWACPPPVWPQVGAATSQSGFHCLIVLLLV